MSWIRRLRKLLGRFWTRMFAGSDIILWVENLFGLVASRQQSAHDRWFAGQALSLDGRYQDRIPYVLLLKKSTAMPGEDAISDIGRPAWSFSEILTGKDPASGPGADESDSWPRGWVLECVSNVPAPSLVTDHVLGSTHTLFAGIDYDWHGGTTMQLYADPDKLSWPTVVLGADGGSLVTCYRVFGWMPATSAVEDAVAAFESPELVDCAVEAWDVHTNGATVLAAKRLFSSACDSVVSAVDGTLLDAWTEQGINCAVIGDYDQNLPIAFYSSRQPLRGGLYRHSTVKAGDTLFGTLYCYPDGASDSQSFMDNVPGIHVTTDAGVMFARNAYIASVPSAYGNMLPLDAAPEVVSAYQARCGELSLAGAPSLQVPAYVNPCTFVLNNLRAGCGLLMCAAVRNAKKAAAALACIRRSSPAEGIVQVYLRAEAEDPGSTTMSISSASAFEAAVAVTCSVALDINAEARVFI